jgi:hypothetical protein
VKERRGGLRVDSLVAGDQWVTRVSALVTTASARTVIAPQLAVRVARKIDGMTVCTRSPAIGRTCGPTARVVTGCRAATVEAIVAPLSRGVKLAIGRDVVEGSVKQIELSPSRPAKFVCRARSSM